MENIENIENIENRKATILVVDDVPINIDILRQVLKDKYKVKIATNGPKALKIARSENPPDLILLDVIMPDMDGYQVCKLLKEDFKTSKIPVIFVSSKSETNDEIFGFEIGAVDYIAKPISAPIVLSRVRTHLSLYDEKKLLDELVAERTLELDKTRLQIIFCLGHAAEYKDNETGMHVIRMSQYSRALALAYGMDRSEAEVFLHAAPMHDIGKIGIPDNILLKPGKLTDDEWQIMSQHPLIGADILGDTNSTLFNMAREISLTHHEKWDGSGYPYGIKGEKISIYGRISAIADVFDALTTERPYKDAWPVEKALELLQRESGSHFDPVLIKLWMQIIPQILEIKALYSEDKNLEQAVN